MLLLTSITIIGGLMLTVLPEAPTLDVVSDQLPLVFHPEPLLHEDDPVLEDDDVRQVERVRDVVRKEPLPNVLVALVFSEEEPEANVSHVNVVSSSHL